MLKSTQHPASHVLLHWSHVLMQDVCHLMAHDSALIAALPTNTKDSALKNTLTLVVICLVCLLRHLVTDNQWLLTR